MSLSFSVIIKSTLTFFIILLNTLFPTKIKDLTD